MTEPTLTPTTPVVFSYPPTSSTHVLNLPKPHFDNSHEVAITRINRESRGQDVDVGIPNPGWPVVETLKMKFTDLNLGYVEQYIIFTLASLGKEIKFLDWEGRTWIGIITNPDSPMEDKGPNCDLEFTIIFEGELQ